MPESPAGDAAKTDCCTVRTPLPAVAAAIGFPTVAQALVVQLVAVSKRSLPSIHRTMAKVIPPQSPPGGSFSLRI